LIVQVSVALLIIAATGTTALATPPDSHVIITFLDVSPAEQPPQGEAILVRTPDAKTILIDGGLDATSLSQELDSRLPSWQRTLDAVILTSPRAEHLTGLQDIVTRYQIGEVIDVGMLHPSTAYALWRRTISERTLTYIPATQGTVIRVGTQIALQILWPSAHLHKGTDEVRDNSMVLRLVTPSGNVLLLGAATQSKYALAGLLTSLPLNYLRASLVQILGEVNKPFPSELTEVLQQTQLSTLVITPGLLNAKLRKSGKSSLLTVPSSLLPAIGSSSSVHILQTAQTGTIALTGGNGSWNIDSA
jgi:beta-lactamase superfamily II metal-dependent hydrolase